VKEKLEISESIRGVMKMFKQLEQKIEEWESWQQEVDTKWAGLRKVRRKNNIVVFGPNG
jgi:hypothetical protein